MLDPRIPSWDSSTLRQRHCPTCYGIKASQHWVRPDHLSVMECSTCKTIYVSPAPDEKSLERFYTQYHQLYFAPSLPAPSPTRSTHKKRSFLSNKLKSFDLRLARITQYTALEGKVTLDVGCGRGKLMGLLMSMGAQVYGVDPDQGAVDYAKASGFSAVWQGGVDTIDPSLDFDLITISDVIEHPLDPTSLLLECAKRLKPSGLIMIWTPNADHARVDPEGVMFRIHLEHMQYFSEASLKTLCHKAALTVLHTEVHGHPYLGTIHQITGKRQRFQRIRLLLHMSINLIAIKWPKVFENFYLRKVRGTYSLLAILQR